MSEQEQSLSASDLDELDRQIVQATQAGLPLVSRPYEQVAQTLGISSTLLQERFNVMLADKRIRRIGAVPNHYRLGYVANGMAVWDVLDEHSDRLGEMMGALDFVSHCYRRPRYLPEWPYNLFTMIHGHNRQEVIDMVEEVARMLGDACKGHDILFSTRILKKTGMRLKSASD